MQSEGRRPDTPKLCLVCGLCFDPEIDELPWGEDGVSPTFAFCHCCDTEFGYQDSSVLGMKRHRQRWIADGYRWTDPDKRPTDWNPAAQLAQLPGRVL